VQSLIGVSPKIGRIGQMKHGEIWFASLPSGDRPVLVLTRDPVADRIGSVVVAALSRTQRGLVSELALTKQDDGLQSDCVVNFDNVHTIPKNLFRRKVAELSPFRQQQMCEKMHDSMGC
jgi:mRNA interferase MazF